MTPRELIGRGWSYQQAGDLGQAEQTYLQVLQLDTEQPDAWYLLGVVCHVQGRLAEAVAHYERSLALRPAHADTQNNLGAAYYSLGRTDEAKRYQKKLEELRGDLLRLDELRRQVRANPDHPGPRLEAGRLCAKLGRDAEAANWLRSVLRLDPGNEAAQRELSRLSRPSGPTDRLPILPVP